MLFSATTGGRLYRSGGPKVIRVVGNTPTGAPRLSFRRGTSLIAQRMTQRPRLGMDPAFNRWTKVAINLSKLRQDRREALGAQGQNPHRRTIPRARPAVAKGRLAVQEI